MAIVLHSACALFGVSASEAADRHAEPATQPSSIAVQQSAEEDFDAASSQPARATTQPSGEWGSEPPAAAPRRAPASFHFEQLTLDAGVDSEWQQRSTNSDSRSRFLFERRDRQSDRVRRFEESIGLNGAGDIVNDRFVRYQFDLRGGLSQESFRESRSGRDLNDDPDGDLLEYDARATFFPAGRVSANVFALKRDERVPRMFLPSLERQRERYGAELVYSDRILPMRLAFESAYEELLSFNRSLNDDERRNDRRLEYEATWQPSEYHSLRLDYEYDDRRESYSGTDARFDTVRNYVTLNHAMQFGDDHKSRLDTLARFQDEIGDLARDVYELAPQLRIQHTDTFSSNVRAQYLRESFDGAALELFRADYGLNQRVGDWLDAGLQAYGLTEDADRGGDSKEWGGVASAAGSRDNSLGRLTSNLSYTHAWERADGDGRDGVAIGEALTLRDPLPAYLAHTDVRRISIVVTDVERRRTFFPGQDYNVVQIGRYTWISRIMTGRIVDGQTVLVSYLYRTAQGFELNRDRVDFRVQQAFKNGWTPYYAASLQAEDIDRTRFRSFQARDVNRHRLGVDYRQKRWFAGSELEYNDDNVDPYKALHLRADATIVDKAPHSLSGRSAYSFLRFDGSGPLDPHEASLFDFGTSYRYLIDPQWDFSATAAYRYEDDSRYGITHGVDLAAGLNWRLGQFTASVELEYDLLDLPGKRDGTFAVWLKLRRSFPLLGGRTP